jgi:hypothetical protein
MRAVAVCTSHRAEELAGPHVLGAIDHYDGLSRTAWFEETLKNAAPAA